MSKGLSKSAIWGELEGDRVDIRHDARTRTTSTLRFRNFTNGDKKLLVVIKDSDGAIHYEHEFDTSGPDSAEVIANAQSHAERIISRDFKSVY